MSKLQGKVALVSGSGRGPDDWPAASFDISYLMLSVLWALKFTFSV